MEESNNLDIQKVYDSKKDLESKMSYKELNKLIREILYDTTYYYDSEDKGVVYDGSYSKDQIQLATDIVRHVNGCLDILSQVVVDHREFEKKYLESKGYPWR